MGGGGGGGGGRKEQKGKTSQKFCLGLSENKEMFSTPYNSKCLIDMTIVSSQ